MTDNLHLGPDAQINHALALLRQTTLSQPLEAETTLHPGIRLVFAPNAAVSGTMTSPKGQLISLDVQVATAGDWAAVHFDLGPQDLVPNSVIGLMCRTQAGSFDIVQPCLRSGTKSAFIDCFFAKQILSAPKEGLHLDILEVARTPDMPLQAPWRELILFLPTHRLVWSLLDLRVFIL